MKIKEGDLVVVHNNDSESKHGTFGVIIGRIARCPTQFFVWYPNQNPPHPDTGVVLKKHCHKYAPTITVGVSGTKAVAQAVSGKENCCSATPIFNADGKQRNFAEVATEVFIDVVKQKMLQECKAEPMHIFKARDQYIDTQARLVEKLCKCYHSQVNEFVADLIGVLRRLWEIDIDSKLGILSYSCLREPRTPEDDLKDFIRKWSQQLLEEDDS